MTPGPGPSLPWGSQSLPPVPGPAPRIPAQRSASTGLCPRGGLGLCRGPSSACPGSRSQLCLSGIPVPALPPLLTTGTGASRGRAGRAGGTRLPGAVRGDSPDTSPAPGAPSPGSKSVRALGTEGLSPPGEPSFKAVPGGDSLVSNSRLGRPSPRDSLCPTTSFTARMKSVPHRIFGAEQKWAVVLLVLEGDDPVPWSRTHWLFHPGRGSVGPGATWRAAGRMLGRCCPSPASQTMPWHTDTNPLDGGSGSRSAASRGPCVPNPQGSSKGGPKGAEGSSL